MASIIEHDFNELKKRNADISDILLMAFEHKMSAYCDRYERLTAGCIDEVDGDWMDYPRLRDAVDVLGDESYDLVGTASDPLTIANMLGASFDGGDGRMYSLGSKSYEEVMAFVSKQEDEFDRILYLLAKAEDELYRVLDR